ncbi:MAG: AAA family ATPase [Clostridia bacterium]|nr:AAA family ATPase [Clostridia bacterium]
MELTQKKNSLLKVIMIGFCLMLLTLLSGCSSTDQSKSFMNRSGYDVTYVYNEESNETKVTWGCVITNETIYDIKTVEVTWDLFNGDTHLEEVTYIWDIKVGHGDSKSGKYYFIYEGKVTEAQCVSWTASYDNLWQSYEGWWIGSIIGIGVGSIVLIIFMIINDGDVFAIFEDGWWIILPYLIPILSSGITSVISTNWVPICIVGGALVATAIIVGIAALIYFLIDSLLCELDGWVVALIFIGVLILGGFVCGCIFWKWWASLLILIGIILIGVVITLLILKANHDDIETITSGTNELVFDASIEDVADYTQDTDKLEYFTLTQLKEYCRDNKIKGYSSLTKQQIIYLIASNSSDEKTQTSTTKDKSITKSPSSKRGKITFDSIAGLNEAKETFKDKVVLPFEHPELFEKFGKKAGGGILLYGLPGTGKTMFAEAASNELNALFISIKCSDIKSKWYGESEQKVKSIFTKARNAKRAIIFFDEFEAIGSKRTDDANNGNNDLVPQILAEMQGVGSSKNDATIMVIAATNKPWAIDSAFMRPGRFDEKIYIPLPDYDARVALFKLQLENIPVSEDLDYNYLAKITEGFNGADIKEVCEKLKMSAIKDSLEKNEEQTIGMDDVARIEKSIKSSVSQEDIAQLKLFEEGLK